MPQHRKRLDELFKGLAGAVRATEAAAFSVCRAGTEREHLHLLTHVRGGPSVDDATREAAVVAFEKIVRPCVNSGTDVAVDVESEKLCLLRFARDDTATVAVAFAFIVRRGDREEAEAALLRLSLKMPARELHNQAMQRTRAAGMVSFLRNLLGRDSGR